MSLVRNFSSEVMPPPGRTIDSDAPAAMRLELLDVAFTIAERPEAQIGDERLYRIVCQSLGVDGAAQPYGGFRHKASKIVSQVEWQRAYDLVCRIWAEFAHLDRGWEEFYRTNVNRILSANGVAWDLGEDGKLHRILPTPAAASVQAAIHKLEAPRFAAARELFQAAQEAYDDRPRRDRDACANAFDSLEAVAKEVLGMPTATFGDILKEARHRQTFNPHVIGILEAINTNRNRNYGHGVPFSLSASEVDFTYLTCVSAILLLAH